MRLSLKIAIFVGLGALILVLGVSSLSMRRDAQIVEDDIERDATLVAATIAVAAEGLPPRQVEDLVRRVTEIGRGVHVTFEPGNAEGQGVWKTKQSIQARAPIAGGPGSIVVVESLALRDRILSGSLRSLATTSTCMVLLSVGAGLWLGRRVVGKRVNELVEKTRRVARGHFDEPVAVDGADELTLLASELNFMAGQLQQARSLHATEAKARLDAEIHLRRTDRLRTVGQLAAGIAHELGTPLNVISGRASLLMRHLAEDQQALASARAIHEQAARITVIVRRFLDFSRPSPPQRSSMDLEALVRETVALVQTVLREGSVSIEVACPESVVVELDIEQMRQVLSNLVVNAGQAAPHGQVRISIHRLDRAAVVHVDDSGTGVPDDLRERVVEPFFTTKDPGEGTGLGLSVVQRIVREHGGRLEIADSTLGGARFSVFLPIEVTR